MKSIYHFKLALQNKKNSHDTWHYKGLAEKKHYHLIYKSNPLATKYLEDAILSFKKAIRQPKEKDYSSHYNAINYSLIAQCHILLKRHTMAKEYCLLGLKENRFNSTLQKMAVDLGIS